MNKKLYEILEKEIDSYVNNIDLRAISKDERVLNELFSMSTNKLMNNIGSMEDDGINEIPQENWDWFIDTLRESIAADRESWLKKIKSVKIRILVFKYFTKRDMIKKESLENYLRTNIRIFFGSLQNYVDINDFQEKVFALPPNILYSLIRYMLVNAEEVGEATEVVVEDLKERIGKLKQLRMRVADDISMVTRGYKNTVNFKDIKILFDNGLLFEDNLINRGINEFVYKMLSHSTASKKLKDIYPGAIMKNMQEQLSTSSAYMEHITAVKSGSGQEFFTKDGKQIGKRFDNQIDLVKSGDFSGYVVDNKSRFKEPNTVINSSMSDWQNAENAPDAGSAEGGGPSGGASSFGGGGGFSGGGGSSAGEFEGDADNQFAAPGSEGEIPGTDDKVGEEEDGTPMPKDEQGFPEDFGTVEDNKDEPEKSEE